MIFSLRNLTAQQVEALMQDINKIIGFIHPIIDNRNEHRFQLVTEITDLVEFGHFCTAFQRMQIALQLHDQSKIRSVSSLTILLSPGLQGMIAHIQKLQRLFDKDLYQLIIVIAIDRFIHHRQRFDKLIGGLAMLLRDHHRMLRQLLHQALQIGP